jgi:hypothetical protein
MFKSSRIILIAICIFSFASVFKTACEENNTANVILEPESPPFGL